MHFQDDINTYKFMVYKKNYLVHLPEYFDQHLIQEEINENIYQNTKYPNYFSPQQRFYTLDQFKIDMDLTLGEDGSYEVFSELCTPNQFYKHIFHLENQMNWAPENQDEESFRQAYL